MNSLGFSIEFCRNYASRKSRRCGSYVIGHRLDSPNNPVCLFVCLFVQMIFPWRELGKLPHGDINTKLATANLSHTNIGLTSMIMSCTNREIVKLWKSAVRLVGLEPTTLWLQVLQSYHWTTVTSPVHLADQCSWTL